MNLDIVMTWPTSCDFPVWRSFLRRHRAKFQGVFVAMMNTHEPLNFTRFLEGALADDNVTFVDHYLALTDDWRNNAVNGCLAMSKAEWVWFTEQDFFIADPPKFFAHVEALMKKNDVIWFKQGDRVHPACIFIKREMIEKTKRDFGIIPNVSDHFSIFTKQVEAIEGVKIADLAPLKEMQDYFHMNGLTHNYSLIYNDKPENLYGLGPFLLYNSYARMQDVPQDNRFIGLTFKADMLLAPLSKFFTNQK